MIILMKHSRANIYAIKGLTKEQQEEECVWL